MFIMVTADTILILIMVIRRTTMVHIYHPAGFFLATMYVTAVMISVSNQNYYYNQGVYYTQSTSGYVVVPAPVGASVTVLPSDYTLVVVGSSTYYYYAEHFIQYPQAITRSLLHLLGLL